MKQRFLFSIVLFLCSFSSIFSQTYRNEWIDFTKTYYRFSVIKDGVCRINTTELPTVLQSANAQDFQLWKNGVQVPIYTSVSSGALGSGGYIEFWGQMNDGKADSVLYLNPAYQTNNIVSLETDSSTYFLTLNSGGTNARLSTIINDLTATVNPLPSPLPYFMDTIANGFKERLWAGFAQIFGSEYVVSAAYDKNEGWTTGNFSNRNFIISNLKAYKGGDAPNMQFSYAGGSDNILYNVTTFDAANNPIVTPYSNDLMTATFNGTQIDQRSVSSLDYFAVSPINVAVNNVSSNDDITFNLSTQHSVPVMLGSYKLVYPHTFNFNNQQTFAFDLPANPGAAGTYLEISNFASGSNFAPILIDITNGKRYACVVENNIVKVRLQASSTISKCVLYSGEPTLASHISNFTVRNFKDYSATANQANYIFIANSVLNSGSNNQVEAYRTYRASTAGGGYKALVYDVDELTDQFGYGIYKHPLGVHNFLLYATAKFSEKPKYTLLLGHGVNYIDFYGHQGEANANILNMVPTWGNPASDVLLSAPALDYPVPTIPIGRVSVVNNTELKDYLDKVKQFDQLQATTATDQATQDWKKKSLFLIGAGTDVNATLSSYMESYASILKDTLVGSDAHVYGETGTNLTQASAEVKNLINNGVPLLTYFGHATSTSLDFNLSDPNEYINTNGKYPFFSAAGCNAGNFFTYDNDRLTSKSSYTISEKFTLAQQRGAVGFLSSTHFGVVNSLDYYNRQFFIETAGKGYGQSIGNINQAAYDTVWRRNRTDYITRLTLEETALNGDPSVVLYAAAKPDYDMEPQNISISPSFVSVADDSFKVTISVHNLGKAINDSVKIKLQWQDPSGKITQLGIFKIKGVRYVDSTISLNLHIVGNTQQGTNYITATVDPDNVINEFSEANNTAVLSFQISPDEIRPIYPYPFSIVNTTNFKLVASTADPYQASRTYQVEMDTTELFNSAIRTSAQVTQVGGEVEFAPPMTGLVNNTVYYWRVAPIVNGVPVNYRKSSFLYNTTYSKGWNQSDVYQHFKSTKSHLSLDSVSRKFSFGKVSNALEVHTAFDVGDHVHGGTQTSDFATSVNGNAYIYGSCYSASITFYVFDTLHLTPWENYPGYKYGSVENNCTGAANGKQNNFTFPYFRGPSDRKTMMDFMNLIPNGYYVVAKMEWPALPQYAYLQDSAYPAVWRKDTLLYGKNQSIPDYFIAQGFKDIDLLTTPRLFTFIYKKNDQANFNPVYQFSQDLNDKIVTTAELFSTDTLGSLTSPVFGPAKAWSQVHWKGHSLETVAPFTDSIVTLQVISIGKNGNDTIVIDRSNPDFDISSIDASIYPYIQLKLTTGDRVNATPWQLDSWRLDYTPQPEGALAPNLYTTTTGTTNATSIPYKFGVAFKNISEATMNPLKLKLKLTDANGNERFINLPNTKSLVPNDTANIYFEIPTDTLNGTYNIYLGINADSAQTEQYFFNNFLFKQFSVTTPLPVKFINFQATPNVSNVSLQWQVTNEQGANYYVVERSADGVQFSTIGKVTAYKNNALMNTYSLIDANPINGKNFYRIRILNQDGTSEFSEIRVVSFGKDNVVKIYPNPVQSVLNVNIPSDGKLVTLVLTNASGQKILQKTTLGSTQLGMTQFAAGIYYLQVKDANGSTTFRVEKQ